MSEEENNEPKNLLEEILTNKEVISTYGDSINSKYKIFDALENFINDPRMLIYEFSHDVIVFLYDKPADGPANHQMLRELDLFRSSTLIAMSKMPKLTIQI